MRADMARTWTRVWGSRGAAGQAPPLGFLTRMVPSLVLPRSAHARYCSFCCQRSPPQLSGGQPQWGGSPPTWLAGQI